MYLRNYCEKDLTAIEKVSAFCAISIQYHKDIHPDYVRCVVNSEDEVIAVGYLKVDDNRTQKKKRTLGFSIFIDDQHLEDSKVKDMLVSGLIEKFNQIKKSMPEYDFALRVFCPSNDIQEMQFYLTKGFCLNAVIPVLKYDLDQETKHLLIPDNVHIAEYPLTEESIHRFIAVESTTNPDSGSEAELRFSSGDPSFNCYAAICDDKIVGAISIWSITEDRAATENIFVIESFRQKNIARELIATAFDELKKRGMKIATLSLRGTNLPAMKLYQSIGYTLYDHLIEMIYE